MSLVSSGYGRETLLSRCKYLLWITWRRTVNRPVLSVLLLLVIIYVGASVVIMVFEDIGFGEATLEIFPTFLGELGIIESPYLAVQICNVVGMLVSITFLAIVTAKITSVLVEYIRRGGSMAKKVRFSGHTIICGWNFQGERIIRELLAADVMQQQGIVILTDSEERPVKEERVEFIKGDPSQDENLIRAGVMNARSVIVLTDLNKGVNEADAEALMVTLAVESLNREVHTCVQIMNSANRMHLERAHTDEIICLDQLGGNLAVASALNHGISRVVSELLTFNIGSEFYRYDKELPDKLVGREFAEVAQILAQQRIVLLAIETGYSDELIQQLKDDTVYKLTEENRAMVVNPQSRYEIRQGDALFIIAESEPTEL
jgi:voltage-gated potassium channel